MSRTSRTSRSSRFSHALSGLALACLAPGLSACTEEPEPETYDPDAVIAEAIELSQLERLDLNTIPSVHNIDGFGELYANEAAAEVFRSIDGTDPTATAEFPRGSILVKNNLDLNGDPLGALTILSKFEAGYSPDTKDWFFAMVNFEGEVLNDTVGSGVEVYACYDCHSQMGANTDLIIGIDPAEHR